MARLKFDDSPFAPILKQLSRMKYQDMKAAAIVRGLDFTDVVAADFLRLQSWLLQNWNNKQDPTLLEDFDNWMDDQLKKQGYKRKDPVRQYRQFSAITEHPEPGKEVKIVPPKNAQVKKPKKGKRQRSDFGIFTGTKKDYTYHLTKDLHARFKDKYDRKTLVKKFQHQLFEKVEKKYPGASEKSVKIWMNKLLYALYA